MCSVQWFIPTVNPRGSMGPFSVVLEIGIAQILMYGADFRRQALIHNPCPSKSLGPMSFFLFSSSWYVQIFIQFLLQHLACINQQQNGLFAWGSWVYCRSPGPALTRVVVTWPIRGRLGPLLSRPYLFGVNVHRRFLLKRDPFCILFVKVTT